MTPPRAADDFGRHGGCAQEKGIQAVKDRDFNAALAAIAREDRGGAGGEEAFLENSGAVHRGDRAARDNRPGTRRRRRRFWAVMRRAVGAVAVGPVIATAVLVSASYLSQTSPVDMIATVVQRIALWPSCARFAKALKGVSREDQNLCVTSPVVYFFMARESAISEYNARNTVLEQHYVAVIEGLQKSQGLLRIAGEAGEAGEHRWDFGGEPPHLLDPGIEVWSVNGAMRVDVSGLDPRDGRRRRLTYAASESEAARALALAAFCRKGGCGRMSEASFGALRAILVFPSSSDETIDKIMRAAIDWRQKTTDLTAAITQR